MHNHIHKYSHIYKCTYMYSSIYIYIHKPMHTYVYIYVHQKIGGTFHQLLQKYDNDPSTYMAGRKICDVNYQGLTMNYKSSPT